MPSNTPVMPRICTLTPPNGSGSRSLDIRKLTLRYIRRCFSLFAHRPLFSSSEDLLVPAPAASLTSSSASIRTQRSAMSSTASKLASSFPYSPSPIQFHQMVFDLTFRQDLIANGLELALEVA